MPDLPPNFEIVLTNRNPTHRTSRFRYVIEAEGQPTRTRDDVVAEAWADYRRHFVEEYVRSAAPAPRYEHHDPETWPAAIRAQYERHVALRHARDPIAAYLAMFPGPGDAVAIAHALATGDLTGLRDLAHPVWRDETHQYEIRPRPQYGDTITVRRRRPDRPFRFSFAGPYESYPDIDRPEDRWVVDPAVGIGGRDVVAELKDDHGYVVRVTLNGEHVASGKLDASMGLPGIDETEPSEGDTFEVGDTDILDVLEQFEDGQHLVLVVEQLVV